MKKKKVSFPNEEKVKKKAKALLEEFNSTVETMKQAASDVRHKAKLKQNQLIAERAIECGKHGG